jgi:transposase-like protein
MQPANETEWAERVRQAEASGLSIPAFAAKHQLSKSALYYWRHRLAAEAAEAQASPPPSASTALAFVRLEPLAQQSAAEPIEVLLRNGRVVRVPLAFDEGVLARVIDIAERGER